MRRLVLAGSTLFALLVLAVPARAQSKFFVGAYATLPQGDFKDASKTGWMAAAGFKPFASADGRFAVWAEGEYGQSSSKIDGVDKSKLWMLLVSPGYNLTSGGSVTPYLLGSIGYLHTKVADFDGTGAIVYGGGVGLGFGKSVWADARYMSSSKDGFTTSFILAGAGLSF